MKIRFFALLAMCLTLAAGNARSGVPVSVLGDVTATANQIENMAQMLQQYALLESQLNELGNQFKQMEKDYESVTGNRNLGEILNDPNFREYLPDDWQNTYNQIRKNGYDGLSSTAKTIRDDTMIYDRCQNMTNPETRRVCEARSVKAAQDKAFAEDAYKTSVERVNQIESLMQKINTTNDPKSIAELNARIQAEQAMLQNEQTKIVLYQSSSLAEQRLIDQQLEEAAAKRNRAKYGNKTPEDIVWD